MDDDRTPIDETRAAIAAMTRADHAELLRIARGRTRGRREEAEDLVADAIAHTLEGRRTWRRGITLRAHFAACIRSADGHRRERAAERRRVEPRDDFDPLERVASPSPPPDEELAAREAFNALHAEALSIAGDDVGMRGVIEKALSGESEAELGARLGLTLRELDAARKRLQRNSARARARHEEARPMTFTTSGLGEASRTERADAVELPTGIPRKQAEAWLAVETFLRNNPEASVSRAIEATGTVPNTYYRAKKRLEQHGAPDAARFSDKDLIRPGDPILKHEAKRRCSLCGQPGHRRPSCPLEQLEAYRENADSSTRRPAHVEETPISRHDDAGEQVEETPGDGEQVEQTEAPPTGRAALDAVLEILEMFDEETQRRILRGAAAFLFLDEGKAA